jgi:ribosomal protein S18 acetylase RimI-like enzyme
MTNIVLNNTPIYTLPAGYTLRATTLDDIPAVARVFDAASAHRGENETTDLEDVRGAWTEPKFDLAQSSRVVLDPTGTIVGYVTVWDNGELPVHPYVSWEVHPAQPLEPLMKFLLQWGEERAKLAIPLCPPHARVAYRASIISTAETEQAVFRSWGMTPIRYFNRMLIQMHEAPPAATFAPDLQVRTLDPHTELELFVRAKDEVWQDHYGYVPVSLEEQFADWQHMIDTDKLQDPTMWYIAEDAATREIAAFVLCRQEEWSDPRVGYVMLVGTRRAYRKRGIAEALLRHAFGAFWQRGRKDVSLYVDSSSPTGATRLYERVGMHVQRQYVQYEKELRGGEELANMGKENGE